MLPKERIFVTVAVTWGIFFGAKRQKCFVKIHLHCNLSHLKCISKMSTLPPSGKISADAHATLHVFTVTSRNRRSHLSFSCKCKIERAFPTSKTWDGHLIFLWFLNACVTNMCILLSLTRFNKCEGHVATLIHLPFFMIYCTDKVSTTYLVRIWVEAVEMRFFAETAKVWIHSPTTPEQQSSTFCL